MTLPSIIRPHINGGLGRCLIVVASLLVLLPSIASAQSPIYRQWRDTTLPAERVPNGIRWNEFPIGSYQYHYNFDRPVQELWPYYRGMNVDFFVFNVKRELDRAHGYEHFDRFQTLLDSAPVGGRVVAAIAYEPSLITEAARGREVVFYPFDSSQMRSMGENEHLFINYLADSTRFNPSPFNLSTEGPGGRESIYLPDDRGKVVASGICYDWKPGRTNRFPEAYDSRARKWRELPGDSVVDASAILEGKPQPTNLYYLVVKGHLFPSEGMAPNDFDTLLRVDVMYEVPRGKKYHDASGALRTAGENLRLRYTSLAITRNDLLPQASDGDADRLREVILPLPLDTCPSCQVTGPFFSGNESKRLDLEVVYLGREPLALRSIALRDSITQLLEDSTGLGFDYRAAILREVNELVRDPGTGKIRDAIFSIYSADEFPTTQYKGLQLLDRLLKENNVRAPGDSLSSWVTLLIPYGQLLADVDWLARESYFNPHLPMPGYHKIYRIKDSIVASIRQHNGGQWGIPELFDLDRLNDPSYAATLPGRIADMEETMQRVFIGAHTPYPQPWPMRVTALNNMAGDIRRARRLGKRVAVLIGPVSQITIDQNDETGERDTLANHRFERADIRCLTNVALAYGSKSVVWYEQNGYPWMSVGKDGGPVGNIGVMGYGGLSVADTLHDIYNWTLRRPDTQDSIGLVPNYYLGFAAAHKEISRIDAWLKRVGRTLATLQWRDGYSLHWREGRPGNRTDEELTTRPLPADEIVTEVTARHPVTEKIDPVWSTYVELGLFETKIGKRMRERDRMKDTNYLFVLNRRVFETYDSTDLRYSAAAKRLMDTLTETRTIMLRLNLLNPESGEGRRLLHVREVEPDTAPLPLIGRRQPLDTLVADVSSGESVVSITLGPGRAALLEITYHSDAEIPPEPFFWPGRTRE